MAFDRAGPQTVQDPHPDGCACTRPACRLVAAYGPPDGRHDEFEIIQPLGLTGCAGAPDGIEGGDDARTVHED